MSAPMLETPSRIWRRIQEVEGQDMPSLPSLPVFEDSAEQASTVSESLDLSNDSSPLTSTPATFKSSNTMATIRPPPSTGSTARFAHSIASRSSKSSTGPSVSRASATNLYGTHSKKDDSFDVSVIPSLPGTLTRDQLGDIEIRSSDQDSVHKDNSVPDDYLPPVSVDAVHDGDLDLSDALRPVSRSNSPGPEFAGMTPMSKKYDYSISLKSEAQPSPIDRMRNVSIRRPLSRNTRTPSLTRTESPSPTSSLSSQPTPQSARSKQRQDQQSHAPSPAHIPLPRSATASPMPTSFPVPISARGVPLPRSRTDSPTAAPSVQDEHDETVHTVMTETEGGMDETPMSLPPRPPLSEHDDCTAGTDIHLDGHSESATHDDREPTFSSEEGLTSRGGQDTISLRYQSISPGLPSPSQSTMVTPTPAFQPRARARFNLSPLQTIPQSTTPPDPPGHNSQDNVLFEEQEENTWRADTHPKGHEGVIPATPATAHKRSFLLSVINSTARPRMKFPTPHPHRGGPSEAPATPADNGEESDTTVSGIPARTAFAGVTPRPRVAARPRLSHPLAQAWTVPALASDTDSGVETGAQSPGGYDGAVDRASFISTASSQDLTAHARANASFDPVIGLGDRGHGVGRFNANKLNNYLHGLNRKLQEENEVITARLREYEERFGALGDNASSPDKAAAVDTQVQSARRKNSGRRISAGPSGLGDVAEEAAEGWIEEKAAMEELIEQLHDDLERANQEKEDALKENTLASKALEEEKDDRAKAKERYNKKVQDIEERAQGVVDQLDGRLQDAERRALAAEKDRAQAVKEAEKRLAEVVIERDLLAERTEKAERALANGRDLGSEVNAANERVSKILGDLKNANIHIQGLEEERSRLDERVEELENVLHEERDHVSELERELQIKSIELSETSERINSLEGDLKVARTAIESYKVEIAEHEKDADAAVEHIQTLTAQLTAKQSELQDVTAALADERAKSGRAEAEAKRVSGLMRQVEEALDAAETKMRSDEEEIISLKTKVSSLERELDRSRSRSVSHASGDAEAQEQIEALESELEGAHKEIARLNVLISHSPARKAVEKAKDARIEMLEQEKMDLLDRMKSLRRDSFPFSTPGKMTSNSTLSPMHRHILSMTLRTPKTPGGPLRELSWLQSTMNDPTVSPLLVEIERLQQELEVANGVIDNKLDRLEDDGAGIVVLTGQLEDAKSKIVGLQHEIAQMTRNEERTKRRLGRLRCQKCLAKIDVRAVEQKLAADESSILSETSMVLEPPTPPTRTSEKLRADLEAVNSQLASMKKQWEQERRKLVGDNAVLQDATSRLNAEVRQAKNEIQRYVDSERASERAKAGIQGELDRAKRMVEELERALTTERSRLRALSTGQTDAVREKNEVALHLQRTESDMAEIRDELQRIKQENRALEAELRSNSTVDQKARLLEAKVAENSETIEQLRKERSLLVADHKSLQRQFTQVTEHVNKLRQEHATTQTSHEQRRHELDMKMLEIEDLRRALSEREEDLERAEADKKRIANEKIDMNHNVAALEADLRRVKREAEAFGRDLKALRAQKDKLENERKEEKTKVERAQKQSQTEIRLLKDEVREQKEKALTLQRRLSDHVCAADGQQLDILRSQHKEECKGLIIQIRYLKAKYTRESTLRSDLCNQKRYLLVLLARCERNEQKILAAIAQIGFPTAPEPSLMAVPRRKTLRSVAQCVVFLSRARRASEAWREQSTAKDAITLAYQEVRKRRQSAKDST
ncbi:hypothetical protein NM688_g3757 [Phlebia brevispora]|uniref:Uncharacterized protein n=1 Tax=Phlebia brevispora TaxID=194682 RepID=A0ACC1T4U6_9APHY|nr:hypothetical protein NM688_g3757 [Phlebia brevispora]